MTSLFVLGLLPPLARPAAADDTSVWVENTRSRTRLIAGAGADGAINAGVEIDMQQGWKTYWRYPGDSGVPPRFDFARSENVASVTVLWPAPHKFTDESGTSIGYKTNVIFPLRVTPKDANKPVTLRVDIDYAVCEKVCIPEQANAVLPVTGAASAQDARLAAARALVPVKAALGAAAPLSVRAVERTQIAGAAGVTVKVAAPEGGNTELFAEGPTPAWALPVPMAQPGDTAGMQNFTFQLDGLPTGAIAKGATLTLTVVSGGHAIEVPATLD